MKLTTLNPLASRLANAPPPRPTADVTAPGDRFESARDSSWKPSRLLGFAAVGAVPAMVGLAQAAAGLDATTHSVLAGNLAAGSALGISVGLVVGVKGALELSRNNNASRPERLLGAVLGGALLATVGGVLGSVALPVGAAMATLGGATALAYTGLWAAGGWLSGRVEAGYSQQPELPAPSVHKEKIAASPGSPSPKLASNANLPIPKLESPFLNRLAKVSQGNVLDFARPVPERSDEAWLAPDSSQKITHDTNSQKF